MRQEGKQQLLRGKDRAYGRDADRFDPAAEGDKLGLSRELSLAIWKQACSEATDASGWLDARRAEHQFRQLAERVATQRGRRHPDPGRATRVGLEFGHEEPDALSARPFGPRDPGRDTLVLASARAAARRAIAAGLSPEAAQIVASKPPRAGDARAITQLPGPAQATTPTFLNRSVGVHLSSLFGVSLTRVQIVPNSPAATGSTKAVTKDEVIHFRAGAYQPGTPDGDLLIAHELAHVVQQRGDRGARRGTTKQLEREADRAARLAMRGRAAPITLRAEPGVAYAFNEGEAHDEADVADQEQPDRAGTHGSDDARPTTHEPAHAIHGEAAEPEHAEADVAHDGLGDIAAAAAVLPAEAARGAGPAAKPNKPLPNVATAKPEQGLAQLRGVRPDRLSQLFGQVRSANSADVAKTRATQHANPPKQMSTDVATAVEAGKPKDGAPGAPGTSGANAAEPSAAHTAKANDKAAQLVNADASDTEAAKRAKQGDVEAQRAAVTQVVASTKRQIASWFHTSFDRSDAAPSKAGDKMSEQETRQLSGSIDKIPTTASDVSTDTGPAPELAMKQEAQGNAARERAELEKTIAAHQTLARADSRAAMGEDHIEPDPMSEELTAAPSAASPTGLTTGPALPTVAGLASSEEAGIVAQEQGGAQIDAALTKANTDVTAERGKHDADEARVRADSDAQIRELQTKADADQEAARAGAHTDVAATRAEWQAQIDQQGADSRKQGDKKVAEAMAQVAAEEAKANAEAKKHIDEGQQKADDEKKKGEKEAADAKNKGKEKSSDAWGWVKSKATAAVDGIKKAVSWAIDACRRAVKAVIAAAKKLAMAVIEAARKVITSVIKAVGKALLAISSVVLAAFPALKAKFQAAIKKAVDKAVGVVNKLADALKKGVQKALDALAAVLDKVLQLLEKGINAIIDAATSLVQAAIKAAQAVVDALGPWAKLIKDVASGPGAWIKNLGAAVVDGIKNHLWSAFKAAVFDWFKSKAVELLGIGGIILELLLEGGLTREHIIQMALDALMVAIPAALVAILIERLVSMIVPAAGAMMAIIEGLQAAWGTISRIVAAFAAFVGFLLAVKSGSAGPLFAGLLAAAAVIVLDFVSNWLLKKIASATLKVGAKLKGLAEKFSRTRKAKEDAKSGKRRDERSGKNSDSEDHDSLHDKKDEHAKSEKDEKQDQIAKKVERVERELPPKIRRLLATRPSRVRANATFLLWRAQYGLKALTIGGKGSVKFKATINPTLDLGNGWEVTWDDVIKAIHAVSQELLDSAQGAPGTATGTPDDPVKIRVQDNPAQVASAVREKRGVVDIGSDVHAMHDDHPTRKDTTSIFEVGHAVDEKPPSYQRMMRDLASVDVGRAFSQLLRGELVDATPEQKAKLGVLFVTMFGMEPTHPGKGMRHARDLGNALMATQLLENKQITLESLLTKSATGKDLAEKESRKLPAVGIEGRSQPIQAGAQAVTGKVIGGGGYGPGPLPKTMLAERIRLEREINLFTQWIKATGVLEKLEDRASTIEELKNEIRKRLKQFLARKA